jgi:hypothetical protein
LGDAQEAAILSSIQNNLKQKLSACRCAKHGQSPKLNGKGRSFDKITFEVTGCCAELVESVNRKLGA